jgi:membrane associated rhomboid family serine protease
MKTILLLGPSMESYYTTSGIVRIYIMSSLTSALTHWSLGTTNTALLGSSGILFSLIGMHCSASFQRTYTTNKSKNKDKDKGKEGAVGINQIPLLFVLTITIFLAEEIYLGVTASDGDNVSRLTHITGAVVGVIVAVYGKICDGDAREERRRRERSWWRRLFGGGGDGERKKK